MTLKNSTKTAQDVLQGNLPPGRLRQWAFAGGLALCVWSSAALAQAPNEDPGSIFAQAVLAYKEGQIEQAQQRWEFLRRQHPTRPEILNNLGVTYWQSGQAADKAQALEFMKKAAAQPPFYASISSNLARMKGTAPASADTSPLSLILSWPTPGNTVATLSRTPRTSRTLSTDLYSRGDALAQASAPDKQDSEDLIYERPALAGKAAQPAESTVTTKAVAPQTPALPEALAAAPQKTLTAKPAGVQVAELKGKDATLDERRAQSTDLAAQKPATETTSPADRVKAGPTPAIPAQTTAGASVSSNTKALRQAVDGWMKTWAQRDIKGYLGWYHAGFKPSTAPNRKEWLAQRRSRLAEADGVSIRISKLVIAPAPQKKTFEVRFHQDYSSRAYSDKTLKTMLWEQTPQGWRILRESSVIQR